jgi:hypothetical protein
MIAGLFVALTVTAVAAAAPAPAPPLTKWQQQQQEKFKTSAPADEYFGRSKMSFLGMNNTFRDSAISSGDRTTDPSIINKVALAEDALEAWGKKYPRDPQLARTYFLATQADRKIWTKTNQELAWKYMNRVVQLFPATFFAKTLKADLAKGFTEHYYAASVACATPIPSPAATQAPDANVTPAAAPLFATPSPLPTRTADPTDAPTASPIPTPLVTTAAKGLRVEIIYRACVPPATPKPTPPPAASPSPSPAAPSPAAT